MTMLPMERIAYSAIKDRPRLALPGGARLVVWVIVNIEEWNPRETMPRTDARYSELGVARIWQSRWLLENA